MDDEPTRDELLAAYEGVLRLFIAVLAVGVIGFLALLVYVIF